jgi:hypothetical protein
MTTKQNLFDPAEILSLICTDLETIDQNLLIWIQKHQKEAGKAAKEAYEEVEEAVAPFQLKDILSMAHSAQIAKNTSYGDPLYHEAVGRISDSLDYLLKDWLKEYPPIEGKKIDLADDTQWSAEKPSLALWGLLSSLKGVYGVVSGAKHPFFTEIQNHLLQTEQHWVILIKTTLSQKKGKEKQKEKDKITKKYPQYPAALQELRALTAAWKKASQDVAKTETFRHIGGIARTGLKEGTAYRQQIKDIHRMEKDVLGYVLTPERQYAPR